MSDEDLKCPKCGADVPSTGMSSGYGIGDGSGNVSYQPMRQSTTCRVCGAKLVRNPDIDVPELRQWRVEEPQQLHETD